MKKLFLLASFLVSSLSFAQFTSIDPRFAATGGMMPQLGTGQLPSNMANGQVCPPQMAPMQGALTPGMMQNTTQQYQQGLHGQQMYQPQMMQ
jgi:hypothetical protein